MDEPPLIEKRPGINVPLLIAALVLVLLAMWFGYARAFRASHNVAESSGAAVFSLVFPMIVALLFSMGKRFRNPASWTKIVFWTSLLVLLSTFGAWTASRVFEVDEVADEEETPSSRDGASPVDLSANAAGVDVYFIPFLIDDATAFRLAEKAKADLGIRVESIIAMGSREIFPANEAGAYDPRAIAAAVRKLEPSLLGRKENTHYVVLTDRDLVDMERGGRLVFSTHYHEDRISVVSLAGMAEGGVSSEQADARFYKMIKRAIGEIYFGYQRSTEPTDLMYSPIQSVSDIDRLRDDFTK